MKKSTRHSKACRLLILAAMLLPVPILAAGHGEGITFLKKLAPKEGPASVEDVLDLVDDESMKWIESIECHNIRTNPTYRGILLDHEAGEESYIRIRLNHTHAVRPSNIRLFAVCNGEGNTMTVKTPGATLTYTITTTPNKAKEYTDSYSEPIESFRNIILNSTKYSVESTAAVHPSKDEIVTEFTISSTNNKFSRFVLAGIAFWITDTRDAVESLGFEDEWELPSETTTGMEHPLPTMVAVPAVASTMATWTSSNPAVAEISAGTITTKKAGEATITAQIKDHRVFADSEPVSFVMKVKNNVESGIDDSSVGQVSGVRDTPVYYNLHGHRISAPTAPGIYVRVCGTAKEKVMIGK